MKNPFRYRGYVWDAETELYYLGSRYYDAEVGRMISPDSLITESLMSICGYNLYQYCFNNPINMLDVDGNWPKWVENVAKAVVAVAVTAVVLVANPVSTAAGIAFSAACGGLVGGVMNSAVGESFLNGMIGGAISGSIQCGCSVFGEAVKGTAGAAIGTIVGGGIGSGAGTAAIEALNNIGKPETARKYKELGMEKFPDWYDQKKCLKENFFYKNLPSQTAQDVLAQLHQAWKSFFRLKETGGVREPKPPRFKQEPMDITFLKDAVRQEGEYIRLTIPKQLKKYLKENGTDAEYLYLKTKRFSDIRIRSAGDQKGKGCVYGAGGL